MITCKVLERLVKCKLAMTVGEVTEVKRGGERAKGKHCAFMGGRNAFQWQDGGPDAINASTDSRESSEVGMRVDRKGWRI